MNKKPQYAPAAFKRTGNAMKSPTPQVRPGLRFLCVVIGLPVFVAGVIGCLSSPVYWQDFTCGVFTGGGFLLIAWRGR